MNESELFLLLSVICLHRHFSRRDAVIIGGSFFLVSILFKLGWYA